MNSITLESKLKIVLIYKKLYVNTYLNVDVSDPSSRDNVTSDTFRAASLADANRRTFTLTGMGSEDQLLSENL